MFIERILCPIVTLGPGKRLVIWTKGCSKNCLGCISPEMATVGNAKSFDVEQIFQIVKNIYDTEGFDGVTISGGDPFEQLDELLDLVERLNELVDDILVYTGYVWEYYKGTIDRGKRSRIERNISVLIDGPYIQEQNIPGLALRGSNNQKIIYFDQKKKHLYEEYMKAGRQLQNIYFDRELLTVGIMER